MSQYINILKNIQKNDYIFFIFTLRAFVYTLDIKQPKNIYNDEFRNCKKFTRFV